MAHLDTDAPKVYILHENEDWLSPLRKQLKKLNVEFEEWVRRILCASSVFVDGLCWHVTASESAFKRPVLEIPNLRFPPSLRCTLLTHSDPKHHSAQNIYHLF